MDEDRLDRLEKKVEKFITNDFWHVARDIAFIKGVFLLLIPLVVAAVIGIYIR